MTASLSRSRTLRRITSYNVCYTKLLRYGRKLFSEGLANLHFWLVLIGQLLYSVSMWIAGVQQASMWQATNPDGSLAYSFMETLVTMYRNNFV